MEASAGLVAGSHNRNELVVIHGHEEVRHSLGMSKVEHIEVHNKYYVARTLQKCCCIHVGYLESRAT